MLSSPGDFLEADRKTMSISHKLQRLGVETLMPISVMVELTHACSLRCRHCYLTGLPPSREPELSTSEVLGIVDQLADAGTLYLAFTGGEVFLRRDLWEILQHAWRRDFAIQLLTGGTLLTDEWLDRLASLGTVELQVSIHGAKAETHDWLTQRPGSFEKAMAGVRRARERAIPVVLKTPVTNRNAGEVEAIEGTAHSLGTMMRVDPLITARNCGDNDTFCLRLDQHGMADFFRSLGPRGYEQTSSRLTCGAGMDTAVVNPYGHLFPCIQLLLDCGSLRQSSFSEIWKGSANLTMLRNLVDADIADCVGCARRDLCDRCPGLALLEDGDLLGPSSAACMQAAAKAEVADLTRRSVGLVA